MVKQKVAARCFRQREQGARVDRPEMIQILRAGREAKNAGGIGYLLETEKSVEGKVGDAGFHTIAASVVAVSSGARSLPHQRFREE